MLAKFLTGLPFPGWVIMLVIIGFYLALGTFMEGMSMVITTIPLLFPVVTALGYDPIWFGVVITMLVEIAMISPPDGTVLYVLQGMRRQPGPITDVFAGVMPFMFVYMLAIIVLMVFPAHRAVAAPPTSCDSLFAEPFFMSLTLSFACESVTADGTARRSCCRWCRASWSSPAGPAATAAAIEHHIEELEAIGVPRPSSVPLYYRVGAGLLTQSPTIEALGAQSSGEAEPMLFFAGGEWWLTVASDHTDRHVETYSVVVSKQMCAKPRGHHRLALARRGRLPGRTAAALAHPGRRPAGSTTRRAPSPRSARWRRCATASTRPRAAPKAAS